MKLDMSANGFLVSMLVSSLGFAFFGYGKKQHRGPPMAVGVALMVFPYFVTSVAWMLGIGSALVAVLVVLLQLGA